jgi:ABC-type transport system substrate-binding protein
MKKIFALFFLTTCLQSVFAESGPRFFQALQLRPDDAAEHVPEGLIKGSHIKVYLPTLPYVYLSHAINGALLRPANTKHGWDYDLAVSHTQIDDLTYEFKLREGVRFQDGSPFNADSIYMNMRYFKRKPPLYSKIHEVFDRVIKVDNYTVRFRLREKYGMFMNDLVWIHFYSPDYLLEYGWNGKPTPPNLAAPGPYGLGPYILTEGYAEGDRQTPVLELYANPYYWDKRYPKIEKVTVYTELPSAEASAKAMHEEGEIDIAPIDFTQKIETILSPYAKLVVSPSTASYAIHMNLRTGAPRLREQAVRVALNQAIHQANLLYFVYKSEGQLAPALAAPDLPGVRAAMELLKPYSEVQDPYDSEQQQALREILDGLHLQVLTQENFLPLWRGIEYQLAKVGVRLEFIITANEKDLFAQLLSTNAGENTQAWDLLAWNNDDWFFFHPWTAFLVFRTYSYWSTLTRDFVMDAYIDDLFRLAVDEPGYNEAVYKIMARAHEQGYMLFVPTPHKVFAVNKEVVFTPYEQACLPLWEISVSTRHHSLRQGAYPDILKHPVATVRKNF